MSEANYMKIIDSLTILKDYIEKNNYRGYDPYDALKSPLFNIPFLKKSKKIRFYTQQLVKRSPINLHYPLFVPKGLNPVTLGLSVQAYAYQLQTDNSDNEIIIKKIDHLIDELERLIPEGFSGACWGYDFDWEARYARIDAYQPTVVGTSIVVNALFEYYKITKNEKAKELIISASKFILNDLNRTVVDDTICFSYSPFDTQQVFNASIKGVRVLSQAYSLNADEKLKMIAKKGAEYVCNSQNPDGSWFYSRAKVGGWIDNYHTGYILDSLDDYITYAQDSSFTENLNKGIKFYVENFFEPDGFPKFYNNNKFPLDCTAASQSILSLTRFSEIKLAEKVAKYLINNMQSKKGYFYFRKFKFYTIKTPFMRWSQAWMFSALSYLLTKSRS